MIYFSNIYKNSPKFGVFLCKFYIFFVKYHVMKKILILSLFLIVCLSVIGLCFNVTRETTSSDYLRIHIRANSNSQEDQEIKYEIKEKFIEYLTPKVAFCKTKSDVVFLLETEKDNLKNLADETLCENGFDYTSNVKITAEEFPTRTYEGYTLESGIYDAVVVELGSAIGNNWWCVIYPPLCFTDFSNQSYSNCVYKSKIWEIIKSFFDN